jgi:glycosyltransferase involved in cell wall biosynthesis
MKRVLFYIHNGWVFGKIHNELIKALGPDIYCDIVCWTKQYTKTEFNLFAEKYDYFMSTPEGCVNMHFNFGIPLNRTIAAVHGVWDIQNPLSKNVSKELFCQFGGYFVICPLLQHISISFGIERIPDILRVGIFQNNYPKKSDNNLQHVGMFSNFSRVDQGFDIKRGKLIEEICHKTNLTPFRKETVNFLGIESFYKNIDLIINPALSEGNPYPMLEAFARGIPVLSTPTGISSEYLKFGGGYLLPLNSDNFVSEAIASIQQMKNDLIHYKKLCDESYLIGSSIDWKNIRNEWIRFINRLG